MSETRTDCPCGKRKCPNWGNCAACRARHYPKGGLPACERGKKK